MVAIVKDPLVCNKDDLQSAIHILLGSVCDHKKVAPLCGVLTIGLMGNKIIQTSPEFCKRLTSNSDVQKIILEAMGEAWSEGYYEGYNQLTSDTPKNPYTPEAA